MKILKEDTFDDTELLKNNKVNSLADIYDKLAGAVFRDPRVVEVIAHIRDLTNTINEKALERGKELEEKLSNFNIDSFGVLNLLSKMQPNDIEIIFGKNKFNLDENGGDFGNIGLSSKLLDYIIKYIPKTGIGAGEILLVLLGGKKSDVGDIEFNNVKYELKNVTNEAAYCQDNDDFNVNVNKLFTALTEEKTVSASKLEKINKDQIEAALKSTQTTSYFNNLNLSYENGVDLFNALAIKAANMACKDSKSEAFLLINGLKYKIIKPENIINKYIKITFKTSWSSRTKNFKLSARGKW